MHGKCCKDCDEGKIVTCARCGSDGLIYRDGNLCESCEEKQINIIERHVENKIWAVDCDQMFAGE